MLVCSDSGTPAMTILLRLEYCSRSSHLCAEDFNSVFSSLTALVSSCMVLIKSSNAVCSIKEGEIK